MGLVVDVSAHQGYTLCVKQTAKTDRQPTPIAKKKRKSKSKSKAKTEPVISERVKGYLEQLKIARAHLPAAVKYLTADS